LISPFNFFTELKGQQRCRIRPWSGPWQPLRHLRHQQPREQHQQQLCKKSCCKESIPSKSTGCLSQQQQQQQPTHKISCATAGTTGARTTIQRFLKKKQSFWLGIKLKRHYWSAQKVGCHNRCDSKNPRK